VECPRREAARAPLAPDVFLWHGYAMRVLSRKAYLVLLLGDISILYLSVWATLVIRHFAFPDIATAGLHLTAFSLFFPVWFVVYFAAGLYGRYTILFLKQLPKIIFAAQAINVGFAALFFFAIPFFNITPKTVLVIYLFISTTLLLIWRVYMYPHISVRREIGALLLGTGQELSDLAEEVNRDPVYPLEFRAIVHPELSSVEEIKNTISKLVSTGKVSTIVADMSNHALDELLQFVYDLTFVERKATFIDVRQLYQEIFEKVPLSLIDDRWLLQYVTLASHTTYSTIKRLSDILLAIVLGTLSLILYPFIMAAIWLEDRGKVFVVQERVGLRGKPIQVVKFRSMTGDDGGEYTNGKAQYTVTKIGALLRRTRLDEVPQLLGILKGDMSFIGPRPELPALVAQYRKSIPHYNLRHLVVPGLSGWAQVKHNDHPHHEVAIGATEEKLAHDLYYIKQRSLWLDFYITLLTIRTIFAQKGS
jgi:lipopolysaccharide/colanic/teichoic acid biosynthesis glycosyltransferase